MKITFNNIGSADENIHIHNHIYSIQVEPVYKHGYRMCQTETNLPANGTFELKSITAAIPSFQKQKLKVTFILPKPFFDIFFHGFNHSSCPLHSLKIHLLSSLLLQCHTYLLKYVFNCEEKFLIFIFWHCK